MRVTVLVPKDFLARPQDRPLSSGFQADKGEYHRRENWGRILHKRNLLLLTLCARL